MCMKNIHKNVVNGNIGLLFLWWNIFNNVQHKNANEQILWHPPEPLDLYYLICCPLYLFGVTLLLLCEDSINMVIGLNVQADVSVKDGEHSLEGFCHFSAQLHLLATRGLCCPHNCSALTVFCCSGFLSEQQISKLAKFQQSSCSISISLSTFCFCCWLQLLVGSDSACWVQLQPDSELDSVQLWEICLHHCHHWRWLQHQSGAENLLTAHWNHNIQHNTTSVSLL